jgi:hypothetical protein
MCEVVFSVAFCLGAQSQGARSAIHKWLHAFEQASAPTNESGDVHRVQQQCTVVIVVSAAGGYAIASLRRVMGFEVPVLAARQRTPKENEQSEHSS